MPFFVGGAILGGIAVGAEIYKGIQGHNDADRAAKALEFNEHETRIMTKINLLRQDRKAYQVFGAEEAAVSGAGFSLSGSALDILKSSVSNASLDASLISTKGELEAHGYAAQATAAKNQATESLVEGGLGAVSALGKAYSQFGGYA